MEKLLGPTIAWLPIRVLSVQDDFLTSENKFDNLSLEQLIRLEELVKKKDYSHEKKANKSKAKLLKQINVEIYKRDDSAIWK